jgi:hypothetical protein
MEGLNLFIGEGGGRVRGSLGRSRLVEFFISLDFFSLGARGSGRVNPFIWRVGEV